MCPFMQEIHEPKLTDSDGSVKLDNHPWATDNFCLQVFCLGEGGWGSRSQVLPMVSPSHKALGGPLL